MRSAATKGTPFRYNDYASATFRFASGLVGRITANFGCVHRHQHVVRVFGTKGTFVYDDKSPRFHTSRDPSVSDMSLDLAGLPASKGDLIRDFVGGILDAKDTKEQTQHEFDVVSASVAADRALSAAETVTIEYV